MRQASGFHQGLNDLQRSLVYLNWQDFKARVPDGIDRITIKVAEINENFPSVAEREQVGERLDLNSGVGEADAGIG